MDLERLTFKETFSKAESDWLFNEFEQLSDAYWVHRTEMHQRRATDDTSCNYYSCLNQSIPLKIREFLKEKSPMDVSLLREIVINKYYPGDWISSHRDRHHYRHFVLIPVQSNGDGVIVEDVFIEDVAGRGGIFEGISHVHSVPKIKNKRYVVLYLYE